MGHHFIACKRSGNCNIGRTCSRRGRKKCEMYCDTECQKNDDLLATEVLQGFGAQVIKVTEEDGTSDVQNVQQLIEQLLVENDIKATFTCGSKRLSKLLQKISRDNHIPAQIALEEHMGCAM